MPRYCQGRSPDQPCCFGLGKQLGKAAQANPRCAFCNTDDLKMAIENKRKLLTILRRLRQFSNEVYLLMHAHVCCVHLSWIKLSVKSGKHTQRVDIIRCFGNSDCCDTFRRCTRKPWRSCQTNTKKQSLNDWVAQNDALAMVRRRASSTRRTLPGQPIYISRKNVASSASKCPKHRNRALFHFKSCNVL